MSKEEQSDTIVEAGREMAISLMESAISKAENEEQVSNQLALLQITAIHILATSAFNRMQQMGHTYEHAFSLVKKGFDLEMEFMNQALVEGELDYHDAGKEPKQMKPTAPDGGLH